MACSKCRKKRISKGRVITLAAVPSTGNDNDLYMVQSRMYTVVEEMGLHFLPGERVSIVGHLLYSILTVDPELFIFLLEGEKSKFFARHPSLQKAIT